MLHSENLHTWQQMYSSVDFGMCLHRMVEHTARTDSLPVQLSAMTDCTPEAAHCQFASKRRGYKPVPHRR